MKYIIKTLDIAAACNFVLMQILFFSAAYVFIISSFDLFESSTSIVYRFFGSGMSMFIVLLCNQLSILVAKATITTTEKIK